MTKLRPVEVRESGPTVVQNIICTICLLAIMLNVYYYIELSKTQILLGINNLELNTNEYLNAKIAKCETEVKRTESCKIEIIAVKQ